MNPLKKRTWAEINLSNLACNYRALRGMLPAGCRYLGVVKADGYGHGGLPVAQKLQSLGADYLGVACIDEAVALRQGGIALPILILGATGAEFAPELLRYDLTQMVYSPDYARSLADAVGTAGTLKIHVKVDTGMSRFGMLGDGACDEIAAICALKNLNAEGIFTHFADADGDEGYTMAQLKKFTDLLWALERRGVTFDIRHCAASAAVLNYPCTYFDMVRPGIALYGHYPDPARKGKNAPELLPVMTLKTRISSIKTVPAGTAVSYGRTQTLTRDSRLAVLPLGYADGFPRALSGAGTVCVGGTMAPIVGRACMDLCMIDLTDLPAVVEGDEVTVFGPGVPLETLADRAGTISYELLCGVSKRIPRLYTE
ncbi:MAG: alanine racemase [Oscillospiraceae bacterium]